MRPVLSAERDLRDLAVIWQMIESSAEIGCPDEAEQLLETLTVTRRRFDDLQGRLIDQMVIENRAELGDELIAKAQCAIDILVRNLYERTADVGFLATDDVVRAFCSASPSQRATQNPAMVERLSEYQAKYTVYDEILLLSPRRELLTRMSMNPRAAVVAGEGEGLPLNEVVHDALVDEIVGAATNGSGYVERFGRTSLAPSGGSALLYGHVIRGAVGSAVGVLVLRFRFADEMKRIFQSVVDDPQRVVLTLVDEAMGVIATSDDAHIAVGASLYPVATGREHGGIELTSFAGREYMAASCAGQAYQGYGGPKWRAVAMVSLLTAFRHRASPVSGDAGETGADVPLDNAELAAVQTEAEAINRELRRVLWNGGLMIGGDRPDLKRLKSVLRQVSTTGRRTRSRVTKAIHDIYRVALARSRHQAHELARLAADLMDRNLYERANDCRWWALSPVVQRVLAQPASPDGTAELAAVLVHINSLYTVYSQLVAFDSAGVIRAVSVADSSDRWVGASVPDAWLRTLASLSNSQLYAVSEFEPTELHDEGSTYVYVAAVRTPVEGGRAAGQPSGGVAIVFNAQRELGAMVKDIIGERAGFAAFVDGSGTVLSSSDPTLALTAAKVLAFAGSSAVIERDGVHYACARVSAPGYREFKLTDGYKNGVSAVVGLRLGATERRRMNISDLDIVAKPSKGVDRREATTEMALFQVGPLCYALPAGAIIEAIGPQAMARTPSISGPVAIGATGATEGAASTVATALPAAASRNAPVVHTVGLVDCGPGTKMARVVCGRKLLGINYPARRTDGAILLLRDPTNSGKPPIGLRVDDVLTVFGVGTSGVHAAPEGLGSFASWVTALIDCEATGPAGTAPLLVQLLSPDRLFSDLCADRASVERSVERSGAGDLAWLAQSSASALPV